MSEYEHHAEKHAHCKGGEPTPTYTSWQNMKRRCGKEKGYENVLYDENWSAFENFLQDMGERPEGHSLDRIDGSQGYRKDNCRWANRDLQNQNRAYCVVDKVAALEIYQLAHSGQQHKDIALKYNCSRQLVSNIKNGHAWVSVTGHRK